MMDKRRKWLFISIALSVIGYFLFTLWAGSDKVLEAVYKVGLQGIAIVLAITFLGYIFRFLRAQYFLIDLGHRIPWLKSFRIFLSGFALTVTPGKVGEAIKAVYLKDYNVPYRQSVGLLLAERFSDIFSLLLLIGLGSWHYPEGRVILLFTLAFLVLFLWFSSHENWLRALEKKWPGHASNFLVEAIITFRALFKMKQLIIGIILGTIAWALEGTACYYLLHVLEADISLPITIYIYSLSLLIGAITFIPGGLGGTELALAHMFLQQHITPSVTATVIILIRFLTLWFSVMLGLIALPRRKQGSPLR